MLSRKNKKYGFTIIELLVVIIILAILASIVIISYNSIQKRAGITTLKKDLASTGRLMELELAARGSYPASFPAGSKVSNNNQLTYRYATLTGNGFSQPGSGDNLNPDDYPYYDMSVGVSASDPNRDQIITSRHGLLLENTCNSLIESGWGKGPADWDSSVTIDYITSCSVYENNALQIITWQQFIDQNKLYTPLNDAQLQAYIQAAKDYNNGAHPNLGITVEKFIYRLKAVHAIQGGAMATAIFYDPSANEYWGVPKPTLPPPSPRPGTDASGNITSYCIEGVHGTFATDRWHVRNGRGPQPGVC